MNNDNRHSFIPDSTLLNSLDLCTTSTSSFLTSTKDQKSTLINLLNNNRRKAIISSPHRLTIVSKINISCITKFNRQLLTHRFAAIVDFGATNIIGEALDCKSTNVTTDSSTIVLDQTTNNLRKAIVGDLIKNPKVFKGDKDNVIQFANSITKIQVHIARKLYADMIIGMDYINLYNLNINIEQQTVSIENNNRIFTKNIDKDYELRQIPVTTSQSIFISPYSNRST
ncbi:unnamed protein product [Rotaria sp. Silwood2]|nr:unnamed protein product [Rotaria sp. Silwood2]